MRILGICGFAGVGKDTAADSIVGCRRFAFADELKKLASSLISNFCCIEANWEDRAFKETWRPFLVGLGAGMRSVEPDFWIDMLQDSARWERCRAAEAMAVISDVRYANEVAWIQSQGGLVIQIQRQGCVPANPEEQRSFLEIAEKFPRLIQVDNSGTIAELGEKVSAIARDSGNWSSV